MMFYDSPSKIFSSLQLFCSRFSVGLLSYNSRTTLIRLDCRNFFGRVLSLFLLFEQKRFFWQEARYLQNGRRSINYAVHSSEFFSALKCIRVNLPSYESKMSNKREQYDWRAEFFGRAALVVNLLEKKEICFHRNYHVNAK